MVVLQINKFFYEKGGTERYFFSVSDELERRGHDVMHFSMRHPRNRPSPWEDHFVDRVDYEADPGTALRHIPSFIRSRQAQENLSELIDRKRPDVAHLHNIYHQLTPSIIRELERRRIPMVMTLHDYKLLCPNYSMFANGHYCYRCRGGRFHNAVLERCSGGSFARSTLIAIESYAQQRSHAWDPVRRLLAPSRFMERTFLEAGYGEERVVYLPAFVSPREADTPPTEAEQELIAGLPERFALYFGRLSPEKGVHVVLEASHRVPSIPVVLCGDGPEMERLRAYAGEHGLSQIRFAGHVRGPILDRILERAAVSVLPTLSPENAPYTVLESAAAGVPVVVSDMGGLPEMAERAGGTIVPAGDSAALAAAMELIWNDPDGALERAAQGKEKMAEHYTMTGHMQRLESIYLEAIEQERSVA